MEEYDIKLTYSEVTIILESLALLGKEKYKDNLEELKDGDKLTIKTKEELDKHIKTLEICKKILELSLRINKIIEEEK